MQSNFKQLRMLSNFEFYAPRIAQVSKELTSPWDRIALGTLAFPGDGGQFKSALVYETSICGWIQGASGLEKI